jgi:peptidyl-prolyl cis-trans isomerase A (cyclophilin A)
MMRAFLITLSLAAAGCLASGAEARSHARPAPLPKVAIVTSEGTITAVLEAKRAPITTANFLHYVDTHRFDGTYFYRAARSKSVKGNGLIQGGLDHNIAKSFLPIKHEPTSKTGIKHTDGTLSMARNEVGSAMADFFITIGPAPDLDARSNYAGYAAFGHMLSGKAVAQRILAKPTFPGGYDEMTLNQIIRDKVKIITIKRIN